MNGDKDVDIDKEKVKMYFSNLVICISELL